MEYAKIHTPVQFCTIFEFDLRRQRPELSILSDDEKHRAEKFRCGWSRFQFVATRATLRKCVAEFHACDPQRIRFSYNNQGKPRIQFPDTDLEFNVSHSGDRALIALSIGKPVGIDVEEVTFKLEPETLASRFFSRREHEFLMRFEEDQARRVAFYRCWTRKEAVLKAVGFGLYLPLNIFSVSLSEGNPKITSSSTKYIDPNRWELHDIHLGNGYLGALSIERCPLGTARS